MFDFGPRTSEDTSTQTRFTAGARGEVMKQAYTITASYSENKLDGTVTEGYFSQVGFARATQDPNSDWNPWSLAQSQAFQDAIAPAKYVGGTLSAKSSLLGVDTTLTGDLMALPAGMLQYATGYQYRAEDLKQTPSPAQFTGDIAGLGGAIKPVDADRSIQALFGEINIPVIKNLDLGLAGRFDRYSDFGSTTNWKTNVRWKPTEMLLLRASYGTGFRAPTLTDLYDPQVLQTSSQFNDPVTGQSDLQVNDLNGGNPDLKPEESKQYGLGFVLQPIRSLAIGLDYFNIKVDNVISQPSAQEIVSQNALGNPLYAGLVTRDPQSNEIVSIKTLLANTGTMEAEGIDINAGYREALGPGRLDLNLNGTYYIKFNQSTPGAGTSYKVGTMVDTAGNPVISSRRDLDGSGVVLRYKQSLAGTWTQGNWATTIGNDYATGYAAGYDLDGNPTYMPALSLWNAQVSFTGFKNTVLTLGSRNIFDEQPETFVSSSNAFQSGYDPTQYDPRGRTVYLTGSFRF